MPTQLSNPGTRCQPLTAAINIEHVECLLEVFNLFSAKSVLCHCIGWWSYLLKVSTLLLLRKLLHTYGTITATSTCNSTANTAKKLRLRMGVSKAVGGFYSHEDETSIGMPSLYVRLRAKARRQQIYSCTHRSHRSNDVNS